MMSHAYINDGARPISAAIRQIERRFADQPTTTTGSSLPVSRATLLRALESARVPLTISEGEFATLRALVLRTQDNDWRDAGTPLAWPSNAWLAANAGKSVTTIKNRIRKLRHLGLLQMRDSSNCKRRGVRSKTDNSVTEAWGFDLTPLRSRFAEFLELGALHTVETALFKAGQRQISACSRAVNQVLTIAAERGMTGPEWPALSVALANYSADASAARQNHDATAFEQAIDAVKSLKAGAITLADTRLFDLKTDPMGSENCPHIQLQTETSDSTVEATEGRSQDRQVSVLTPAASSRLAGHQPIKINPYELTQLFPAGTAYLTTTTPDWDDVCRSMQGLSRSIGIRADTWIEAVSLLGREGAAIALCITAERDARNEIRLTPGCYFAGMIDRARVGKLDLGRTIWGFRSTAGTA